MGALIKKIAQYLVSHWNSLSGFTKWAIQQIASSALVEAIKAGVSAVVDYLSHLSAWVINKIASLLGLN